MCSFGLFVVVLKPSVSNQDWAEATNVIDESQKQTLLMEMARRLKDGDSHAPAQSAMLTATTFLSEATQAVLLNK